MRSTEQQRSGSDLDHLVPVWLTLVEVAEQLDLDIGRVRRLLQDHALIAVRRGPRSVLSVPAQLLPGGQLLPDLPGTVTVLLDCGYDAVAAMRWLLTDDDSLPGSPIAALTAGRKGEVRRRAQALAL